MARFFGVASDDDYTATHKRERLVIWSGPFMSNYEGEAFTLPGGDGYMVTTYGGDKVRVECPTPRTDANFQAVDDAISSSLVAHYGE